MRLMRRVFGAGCGWGLARGGCRFISLHPLAMAADITAEEYAVVERYARREPRRLTLRQSISMARMQMDIGSVGVPRLRAIDSHIDIAGFVRDEILIRLALTLHSFLSLPRTIEQHPVLLELFLVHLGNFRAIVDSPRPDNPDAERLFAAGLEARLNANSNMLGLLSRGFREVRQTVERMPPTVQREMLLDKMESFLESYVAQRLSRRVLVQHYLALREQTGLEEPAGVFEAHCCPARVIKQAGEVVEDLCVDEYGIGCQVELLGAKDATVPYVTSHLWYVAREIMKNAMRATVENHGGLMAVDVPPVRVTTMQSEETSDLWIIVADRGGGMAPDKLRRSWGYGVSDFKRGDDEAGNNNNGVMGGLDNSDADSQRLAGHGFGLPLSRNYMRFFGGDLHVRSLEGYGTHVYIRMRPLAMWKEDVDLLAPARQGAAVRPPVPPSPEDSLVRHREYLRKYEAYIAMRQCG
eukprot:Hpha_TRINITY_DN36083_c0_g1::TRINITY_DN36083_c0_g1_i1::g.170834::m.170834/K00905/BCKDK; [3-methyl-2-oxobutanoate dehydrogenase (acetyl-transferring)] kinase